MWLSRKSYEALMKRNDDRDFAESRREVERVRSELRALRTWLQRNLEVLTLPDEEPAPVEQPPVGSVPGGWRL